MRSTVRRLSCALLVAALVVPLGATALEQDLGKEILEQVLVKVNGDIITKTDLETRQIAALRERLKQDVEPETLKNDDQLKKVLAEITPQILVSAIDELLLTQLGRERGYRLTDSQFKDWLAALRKEQNLEDEQKFQGALKQEGMTVDDLRRNVERQMLIQRVQQDEVGSKLSITEEEARQYYLAHQPEFSEPAQITLREILIEAPVTTQGGQASINVGQDDDARKKAEAARARIAAGEDFATVASEVSTAPSKANGGLIGPITVNDLSEALQKTILAMKPGEMTQALRTPRGYQILKLETFKAAGVQAFDSVRDLVAERVHGDRRRQEVQKFLTRLRGQAIIEWKNAELKKAYDQQLANGQTGTQG